MHKGKLQARLERAEAIISARRLALMDKWADWVMTGLPEQRAAIYRLLYAEAGGALASFTLDEWLTLCEGRLEWTDADRATVAAFVQTVPSDLAAEAKALNFELLFDLSAAPLAGDLAGGDPGYS